MGIVICHSCHSSNIGRILCEELFKQTLLTYFGKKRATHLEDLKSAKEPYEAYNLTYLTLAAKMLKRRVSKLRPKLGIVSYTKNIRTITPTSELIPFLSAAMKERCHRLYQKEFRKAEKISDEFAKMRSYNVSDFRFSLGFAINNYDDKYTIAIYGKDYYQYLSKITRVMKHDRITDLPTEQLTKIRHIKEFMRSKEDRHILRLEITIRGWEQIHSKSFYRYLDKMEQIIRRKDYTMSQLKPFTNTCEICGETTTPLMKIYPRPFHVKKAIKQATKEICIQELAKSREKGLTLSFDELKQIQHKHLDCLYYCEKCKKVVAKEKTKVESLQELKDDFNKDLDKIEQEFEQEITEQTFSKKENDFDKDPPD